MEQEIKLPKKTYKKKADLNTRTGRYFIAKRSGKNKEQAKESAGYSLTTTTTDIEQTKTYEAIEHKYFKDHINEAISGKEVAKALAENITQDKDKGARNKAIEIYKDNVEPNENQGQEAENVIVVFKRNQ